MRSAHNRFKLKRPTKRSTPSRLHWESLEPRLVLDSTVVFNELMYHPVDDQTPEWVELHNQNAVNMDLSGWSLAGGIDYTFPQGTVLPGGDYLVVAANPEQLRAFTGYARALGPFTGALSNGGEAIELRSHTDRVMDVVDFGDSAPWPVGADGSGATLAKRDPHTATADAGNWTFSTQIGGTPGAQNFAEPGTFVFHELLPSAAPVRARVPLDDSLGPAWMQPAFDDSAWTHGTTGVGFDTDTTYDRYLGLDLDAPPDGQAPHPMQNINQSVFVRVPLQLDTDLAEYDTLTLRMLYDDGFAAYVNGVEVARANANDANGNPAALSWFSGASSTHSDTTAVQFVDFDITQYRSAFVRGENVLAFHGLNRGAGDNDFLLSPQLVGGSEVKPDEGLSVALSEIAQGGNGFWVELANTSDRPVNLEGVVLSATGANGGQFVLPARTLPPGGQVVVPESQLGFRALAGERIFLYAPGKERLLDGAAIADGLQGRSPQHEGHWMTPATATPGEPNRFEFEDDIVINEILYQAAPQYATPETPATYELSTLLPFDAVWRYNQSGANLGLGWQQATYAVDNASWFSGPGLLGFETASLDEPIKTRLSDPRNIATAFLTYYFQTEFDLGGDIGNVDVLQLSHMVDGGAVFYLNGHEVERFNMPGGYAFAAVAADESIRDAQMIGPVTISTQFLRPGTNVLSVELHLPSRTSNDVVFGAKLTAGKELTPAIPGTAYSESSEEWIELYNRSSSRTVDLSGWSLEDAAEFSFPQGAVLGPGQFLVIANDPRSLELKHPDTLGSARCSARTRASFPTAANGSGCWTVHGNVADEVHYYDAGRWHGYADGGGSSLELRDPFADNTKAEAWAPSDEAGVLGRSPWQHYSYTRVVESLLYDPPINFHEFHMGMLDAGEVLLDNIQVIEDPNGANIQLLQNGDFQSDQIGQRATKWRIQGTHEDSRVVADPDNPDNKVLHLIAEARTNYFGNHAETTLASSQRVDNGKTYQISFDAKWIAGSPQLHTELYYKDAARTTILPMPTRTGTPGAPNSRLAPNIGPTYGNLRHDPLVPAENQPVTVTVSAADPDQVASMTLVWAVAEQAFTRTPMTLGADGSFQAVIPGQANRAVVQFYVEGTDSRQAVSVYPAAGPESRALYKVDDSYEPDPDRHDFRIIMLPSEATEPACGHRVHRQRPHGLHGDLPQQRGVLRCGHAVEGQHVLAQRQ